MPFNDQVLIYNSNGNVRDGNERAPASIAYVIRGRFSTIEEIVYHYTNINALDSITRNGELWASHHKSMNDFMEIDHAWNVASISAAELIGHIENGPARFGAVKRALTEDVDIYISSFSLNGNALSQWRAYAPSKGVSIGFPRCLFPTVGKSISPYILREVIYNPDDQKRILLPIAITIANLIESGLTVDELYDAAKAIQHDFIVDAAFMKHAGFHEEKEIRLVSDGKGFEVHVRDGVRGPVNYIKVSFDEVFQFSEALYSPIWNLFAGPNLDPDNSVLDVYNILKYNRRKFTVITGSAIPFR